MPSSPDQPVSDPVNAPVDSGLRCPHCDYNLTGLTENRCPECGAAFSPQELRRLLVVGPQPIPGWDDRGDRNIFIAFFRVCLTMWFDPSGFGTRFPWVCHTRSAARFRWMARGIAACIFTLAVTLSALLRGAVPNRSGLLAQAVVHCLAISLTTLHGSVFCEWAVASLLSGLAKPRARPEATAAWSTGLTAPWREFVGFYSSFLVFGAVVLALASLISVAGGGRRGGDVVGFALAGLVCFAWWWGSLVAGVHARTHCTSGTTVAVVLALFVGIGSFLLTMVLLGATMLFLQTF